MIRQLLYIVLLIFFVSCNTPGNWLEFPAQRLPDHGEIYNDMIFVDSLTGYLGGDRTIPLRETNTQYQFLNKAVLYKTRDQGRSWIDIPLNYIGSVVRIISLSDTLMILLQGVTSDSVYILKSFDNGENWDELFSAPANVYIREIAFEQSDNGYFVIEDQNNSYLVNIQNNKCDTVLNLPDKPSYCKIIGNKLFSLTPEENTANSTGVLITDLGTGKSKKLPFDKPYFIASVSSDNACLYIAASHNKIGQILQVTDNKIKTCSLAGFSDYQPDKVFVYGNTLAAIVYKPKDVGFLGVIYHLLISNDNGQTWTLEEIPDPMYLAPSIMYKDKFFMSYCGSGFMQMRKFTF